MRAAHAERRMRERALLRAVSLFVALLLSFDILSAMQTQNRGGDSPAVAVPSQDVAQTLHSYGSYFVENAGHLNNPDVLFYVASGDLQMGFAESAVLIRMVEPAPMNNPPSGQKLTRSLPQEMKTSRGVLLRLDFEGANKVTPHGRDPLPYPTNFFIGNDPSRWRTGVNSYREVVYEELYNGVDMVYRGSDEGVKYDLILAPGTDPSVIRMSYEGADSVELEEAGNLLVHTAIGDVADSSPTAFQGDDRVPCSFTLPAPLSHGFACQGIDGSREVVIDPLVYATFLGGGEDDVALSIAADSAGNAYVTGWTRSTDFPVTPGVFGPTMNGCDGFGCDAFVTKLNPTGSSLVYSTYLGGGGEDVGNSIVVDSSGSAYVAGSTVSDDFPVTPGAFDTAANGARDAFVVKLDPAGASLLYSTYLGGGGDDGGYSMAIDPAGNAYVTGFMRSSNFPSTPGAFDTIMNGFQDSFVTKLDSTGSSVLFSTYLGGGDDDAGYAITIDSAGNSYITGQTQSAGFPSTPGAFDTTYSEPQDAFVTKLDSGGGSLLYSTFLGGSEADDGYSIAVDAFGNACAAGWTRSRDFPTTPGAFDTSFGGLEDGFVVKLDFTGSSLLYSTYIGGVDYDDVYSIAVEPSGIAYLTGYAQSGDFPVTLGAFDTSHGGVKDGFMAKLDITGSFLLYSTFLGGSGVDGGYAIALDPDGNIYATGYTQSANFPVTPGAFDTTVDAYDSYAVKFSPEWLNIAPRVSNLGVQGFTTPPSILHITDATPDLNWTYRDYEQTPQARYDLRVGSAPGFSDMWDPPATPGSTTVVTYGGAALMRGTDYYFAVRANDVQQWGAEVEVKFHLNSIPNPPKAPIVPAQSSNIFSNPSQILSWTSGGDAEGDAITYEWQVAADASFSTVIAQGTTTATASTPFATSMSTTYFWRVRARDDYEPAIWSAYGNTPPGYWTFSVNSPPTVSNLGVQGYTSAPGIVHITDFTPDLSWTYSDPNGDPQVQYWIMVGTSSGGADMWDPRQMMGASTSVTYAGAALQRGVDYFFSVAAYDGFVWSPFSEVLLRLNSIPNPPVTPIDPGDAAVISAVAAQTVSWTSGGDPDAGDVITFAWQVSTDSAFATIIASGTSTSTISSTFATSPSMTYYWRVRAHDNWETSTWSAYGNAPPGHWTFSTSSLSNTPPTITITFPAGGEVFFWGGSPTVTWTSSDAEDPLAALTFWINYTSSAGNGVICGPRLGVQSCNWPLPHITATDIVIDGTVIDSGGLRGFDESGPFTIRPPPNTPPTIIILSPSGGEEWTQGEPHAVTWTVYDREDAPSALLVWINYTSGAGSGNICGPVAGNIVSCEWAMPAITAADVVVDGTVVDTGGLKGHDETAPFTIKAPDQPPTDVEVNYKPIVAGIFAALLAVVGAWSSKKRPWKGGEHGKAVMKAFTFTSMPFVLAEVGTGIASYITGQLSIPPALGIGTAVDLAVLVAGLVVMLARVLKREEMEVEAANEPKNR